MAALQVDADGAAEADLEADARAKLNDRTLYKLHKRVAVHGSTRKEDVYVRRDRPLRVLFDHVWKRLLVEQDLEHVWIHGLGAAVLPACTLGVALETKAKGALSTHVETSSVLLFDDYVPLQEGLPAVTVRRYNSAVHIMVRRMLRSSASAKSESVPARAAPARSEISDAGVPPPKKKKKKNQD